MQTNATVRDSTSIGVRQGAGMPASASHVGTEPAAVQHFDESFILCDENLVEERYSHRVMQPHVLGKEQAG